MRKKPSFKRLPELFEELNFFNFEVKNKFHIRVLSTFTRGVFITQQNIDDGLFLRE